MPRISAAKRFLLVFVTAPTKASAQKIATLLVRNRLAACVSILPKVTSIFTWKGSVDRANEFLLVIKTVPSRFSQLERAVRDNHPYQVPEVIALPIIKGSAPYLDWLSHSLASR